MEELLVFAVVAAFILGFGSISGLIQRTVLTPPMFFVAIGLILGGGWLDLIHLDVEGEFVTTLAELTLVLILFTDASRIDLKLLRRDHTIPVRLLSIGLPLTMILGALLAIGILPSLSIWEAVVLAVILAPTDAALGQAVVSSPRVPVRIRQALNVESGLNDGIALPILLFFISLAAVSSSAISADPAYWIQFAAFQIILGPIAGVVVAYVGGSLIFWAENKGWVDEAFQRLVALGLALLAFALAELIGGNGFIAAFCAGMTLGNKFRSVCGRLYEFAEAEGQLLTLLTFMLYGAIMLVPALVDVTWWIVLYAILSLTIVRLLPVAISLLGQQLQPQTFLFLGWFGPRGIASILYCLLVLERAELVGRDVMYSTIMTTVLFSIIAHGLTAVPGANWYGAHAEANQGDDSMPELMPVSEMPTRLG